MSVELFKQFSLGEQNRDPCGGMLYAMRYPLAVLEAKRDQIAEILALNPALSITDGDNNGLEVRIEKEFTGKESLLALLEELTVLIDAISYVETFGENVTFETISHRLTLLKFEVNQGNLADVYNTVDLGFGEIIRDFQIADTQNKVLSPQQRKELEELIKTREKALDFLNRGGVIIG